jgi:hypothetical protein
MNTSPAFQSALDRFVSEAQEMISTYYAEHYPNLTPETLKVDPGRKYIRIWKGSSAYCFIDSTNGDVLKPATWRAPAKHARGNIFTGKATDAVGPHGARYLA